MKPTYLDIAVPVPLRRSFYYQAPDGVDPGELAPGIRIEVPFGRQKLIGILLGTTSDTDIDSSRIKQVHKIIDEQPVLHPTIYRICLWAANYYQHPIGEVLHTALPILLRQGESTAQTIERLMGLETSSNQTNLARSPRQLSLVKLLQENKQGLSRFELKQLDTSPSIIRAVIEKGLAEWQHIQSVVHPFCSHDIMAEEQLSLNEEQSNALSKATETGTHLIFGITGSGKTEIYLQAIEAVIKLDKQALVLVPEIGLTPQTIQRFKARFNVAVFALHSALTDKERLEAWRQANQGGAAIIIGTRSAIFTPLVNPGLIVIDEEHDASFKQQEGFRYSARDIAVLRGQWESIPVILGSATPSFESYQNALSGKYSLSMLNLRANQASTASYELIGTQHEKLDDGFSAPLISLIAKHLRDKNQVLIFLNRRGFSPVIMCRACGWIADCNRCDARMTYHLSLGSLVCHHCGTQHRIKRDCAECGSDQLVPLGLGTQRLEQTLNRLFPSEKIIRIDRDSTRRKGAMEKITQEVNLGNPTILVGTQLLAKGHHFPNVTLVAVVDIDSGFYSSDYKAIERMGQLLLQVGGRAGRESKPGTVAIQTHFPEQPILKTLIEDGYEIFAKQLLAERSEYELPPFAYQAMIRAEAINAGLAMNFLADITQGVKARGPAIMLGPIPSTMEKRAGKHRAQLLFSSTDRRALQSTLSECVRFAEQSKTARKVKWSVDVDPIDLY